MFPTTSPLEPKGSISLQGYCFINGKYRACEIIEASAETQSARVRVLGSLFETTVTFRQMVNVALKYGNGEVLQNFGAPKINKPESIEYIQFSQVQS